MWLEQRWQVAAFSHEIGADLVPRRIANQPIVFYRTDAGTPVALADACAHRRLPLSLGRRHDDGIQCGYHGMSFRADGTCSGVPGQTNIPSGARVRAYPLVERDGLLWIWTADEALAPSQPVPETPWLHDPAWAVVSGYHHVEADPLLVVDNLLDLSHETFVHAETIGNSAVADSPVTAEIIDGERVRVHRYMRNIEPPPMYAEQREAPVSIDRWHTTTYEPPGYVVIESGSKPSGSAPTDDVQERRIINFITPETATTAHYFWCIARNYRIDDAETSARLRAQIIYTFDQDQALLAAQQRALGPHADVAFPVSIKVDAGPIQGRRLLHALAERERSTSFAPLERA